MTLTGPIREIAGPRHRNPDRRARPIQRADRDTALPQPRGGGTDRLVRGAGAAESYQALQQVREKVSAPISASASACTRVWNSRRCWSRTARRLHHAGRHLDGRHQRAEEDRDHGGGLQRSSLAA